VGGEQLVGCLRACLEPLVRLRDPRDEVAQPVMLRIEPAADDLHRWANRAHARPG
jgi:hypothetical protein